MKIIMPLTDRKFRYTDAITQMRSLLVMQGGREGFFQLDIVFDDEVVEASLLMSRKTLYIDAFRASNNTWHYFSDTKRPSSAALNIAGNVAPLLMTGTHNSLGTDSVTAVFDSHTRFELRKLTNFQGGTDTGLRTALSFAAVACAEAVRFKEAEMQIASLLVGAVNSYKPREDWQTLFKNWQALTKAQSAKVLVRHEEA